MVECYDRSVEWLLKEHGVDLAHGLEDEQVASRLERHGHNTLPEDPPTPLLTLVLEQFKDQLVIILLGSAAISFVLALYDNTDDATAFVDPIVILAILVLNAIVGVSQEVRAESAIAALSEYAPDEATVLRNGVHKRVRATELVPGDIVSLATGDRVPADARVVSIESNSFSMDQALLTGESESVEKQTAAVPAPAVNQDQTNMVFAGTTVAVGHAHGLVVRTGVHTAMGNIHASIVSQVSVPTPLKQKLDDFGEMLAKVITVICVLVWLINIRNFSNDAHGGWLRGATYYFKIAVALAVAAIPEGLAVVITTCLALGTRKMASKNAIVRSLPSVETLGSVNVICTDKTGTLTTNQMSACRVVTARNAHAMVDWEVQGTTFSPEEGGVSLNGTPLLHPAAQYSTLKQLSEICAICNEAELSWEASAAAPTLVGEPTEGSLKVLAEKLGSGDALYDEKMGLGLPSAQRITFVDLYFKRIHRKATFEFTRDRKSMSVLIEGNRLLLKGAPESVLERCTNILGENGVDKLSDESKQVLLDRVTEFGLQGLRVIACALTVLEDEKAALSVRTAADYLRIEQDLTFVGLVAMLDPPRPQVHDALLKCRQAGIRVVVITGDNQKTAETICRQIGLFGADEDVRTKSYTGQELDAMDETAKQRVIQSASLFSRTEPAHKTMLVDVLQKQGNIVAMTGDGVNDAPALKKADIGVAMGSGTDVARMAADMVLADDNFATIELAVEEGRAIYVNTQQFIRYLISSNIGEVVAIFLTVLLGMPEALIPVQLLFVNLVTDGLPATACSFNSKPPSLMQYAPRSRDDKLVSGWLLFRYIVIGTYVGCATVFGYAWWFMYSPNGPQISFHHLVRKSPLHIS